MVFELYVYVMNNFVQVDVPASRTVHEAVCEVSN
jgi:hypothetical protein